MQSIALGAALLLLFALAAAVAVRHMDNLLSFIVIAPGYLVQAWLFETHRALGGVRSRVDAAHPRPGRDRSAAAAPRALTRPVWRGRQNVTTLPTSHTLERR